MSAAHIARPGQATFRPGDRFDAFKIIRLLGCGGISEVYEVERDGKRYALKILQRRFRLNAFQRRHAMKEGEILSEIKHQNLVVVYDTKITDGIFWLQMELLEGRDLREGIHRTGRMSVALVDRVLCGAAHGLHQCHMFQVIHRDVKPENVFLTRQGAKVVDLGLAKQYSDMITAETGTVDVPRGTLPYMSPEHARGDRELTPAADVFSLAIVGYEMLVGHPRLRGESTFVVIEMLGRVLFEPIPPLTTHGYPAYLSVVFERALSMDYRLRQANGLVFAEELHAAAKRYRVEHGDDASRPEEAALWAFLEERGSAVPSFMPQPAPVRATARLTMQAIPTIPVDVKARMEAEHSFAPPRPARPMRATARAQLPRWAPVFFGVVGSVVVMLLVLIAGMAIGKRGPAQPAPTMLLSSAPTSAPPPSSTAPKAPGSVAPGAVSPPSASAPAKAKAPPTKPKAAPRAPSGSDLIIF